MIVIKPAKSYKIMEAMMAAQNVGKANGQQLKAAHYELMQDILGLWKIEVGRYQVFGHNAGNLLPDGTTNILRTLRTNTVQLAKWSKRGKRTVYNLLRRLSDFGWIRKIFHGSNASYEIVINPDLLWLQETSAKTADNVAGQYTSALPPLRQNLPHTPPVVTRLVTNKSNELEGLAPDEPAIAGPDGATPEQPVTPDTPGAGYHPRNEPPADTPVTTPSKKFRKKSSPVITERKRKGVDLMPAVRPETLAAATGHLTDADRKRLPRYLDAVWDYAFSELDQWMPPYVTGDEFHRGQAALAEFFVYADPKKWDDVQAELLHRVDLVTGWAERRAKAGKLNTFIPIPSLWFDVRNPRGFVVTKQWYRTEQHQKQVWNTQSLIAKCVKTYNRAVDSVKGNPAEELRRIRQYLEKKGGKKLFLAFQRKVITAQPNVNASASA